MENTEKIQQTQAQGGKNVSIEQPQAASQNAQQDLESLLKRGDEFLQQENYPDALEAYQAALRLEPANASALIGCGIAHGLQQHLSEAEKFFRRATHADPQNPNGHHDLGIILNTQGRYTAAIRAYKKAIKLLPDNYEPYLLCGDSYLNLENQRKALEYYQSAAKRGSSVGFLNAADIFQKQSKPQMALLHCALALETEPGSIEILASCAAFYRSLELNANALLIFEKIAALEKQNPQVYIDCGDVNTALKRFPEALNWYTRARKYLKNPWLAYMKIGQMYEARGMEGDLEKAVDKYRRAVRADPDQAGLWVNLGLALAALDRNRAALRAYQKVIQLAPDSPEGYGYIGEIYMNRNQYDLAKDFFSKATEKMDAKCYGYYRIGSVYETQGDPNTALEWYLKAIDTKEEQTYAYVSAAQIYQQKDEPDKALSLYRQAIEQDSTCADAYNGIGIICEAKENYTEALENYRKVVELVPDSATGYLNCGIVLQMLDRMEEAIDQYQLAREKDPDQLDIYQQIANAYLILNQYDQAFNTFDLFIKYHPNNTGGYLLRASLHFDLNHNVEALQDYRRVVELDSKNGAGHEGMAMAYMDLEKYSEAIQSYTQVIQIDPHSPSAYNGRAEANFFQDKYDPAYEDCQQALKLALKVADLQQEIRAYRVMSIIDEIRHQYEVCVENLDQILKLEPGQVWATAYKAQLLASFGDFQNSLALYESIPPDSRTGYDERDMGWCLENLGADRALDAKAAYERAVKKQEEPEVLWSQKGVANALEALGDVKTAREKYRYVLKRIQELGEDADDGSLAGWCFYRLREYSAAEESLEKFMKAVSRDPESSSSFFDLALVQFCAGKFSSGLESYKDALNLTKQTHRYRQRGVILIAMRDFQEALEINPSLNNDPTSKKILTMLEQAWEGVKKYLPPSKVLPEAPKRRKRRNDTEDQRQKKEQESNQSKVEQKTKDSVLVK